MTINIRIVGWKISGFRCPDHEVDFTRSSNSYYDVSLIQMPNGTGKTTTLEILRMALSGSAIQKSVDELRRFQKKDSLHGICEIKIELNNRFITFLLNIDFTDGKATYKTTKGSGQLNGFQPPPEISKFLNPDFIDYFILDGELAKQLLSRQQSAAQKVIDALFQVDTLKKISQKISDYWQTTANSTSATTQQGLTRRKNAVEELQNRLSLRTKELDDFKSKLKVAQNNLLIKNNEFQSAINDNQARHKDLSDALRELDFAKNQLDNKTLDILNQSSRPHFLSKEFARACKSFKMGLDRVKLPEAAAREFFEELCEETECICGREINPDIASTIRAKAGQYLGSDDVSLLNAIKTAIDDEIDDADSSQPHENYTSELSLLADFVSQVADLDNKYTDLKIKAGEEDPALAIAQQEITRLELEINSLNSSINLYTDNDSDDDEYNPIVISKKLEKAKMDLAEISNTLSLKSRTEKISKILDNAYKVASGSITSELVMETNTNLDKWLPNNDIRVETIRGHLILKDSQEEGSVGENLSIAYAFLATLFNRSSHSLPFIVDSPAGALGLPIRRHIGQTIPSMSGQFISFVISTERQGFLEGGLDTTDKSIQYITIFRSRITEYMEKSKMVQNSLCTTDGVIVDDREFFNAFELAQE